MTNFLHGSTAGIGHASFADVAGETPNAAYYLFPAPEAPWRAAAWFGLAPKSAAFKPSIGYCEGFPTL